MAISVYALLLLIMVASIQGQTCSCRCGSYTYYPGYTCSSSSICATTCYNSYSYCSSYSTQGCCGAQTCAYYSSSSYYSSYYSNNKCNCKCSSSSGGTTNLVGSAKMSGCNDTLCKEACNSLYPTTCGIYTNEGYCTYSAAYRNSMNYSFILSMIIVYVMQKVNTYF